MSAITEHDGPCAPCVKCELKVLERDADMAMARAHIAELEAKVAGLHALIHEAEADSRAALLSDDPDACRSVVESYIIDGADACERFGPCPSCKNSSR